MPDLPENELEALLKDAFDAQAGAAIGDHTAPPPPRFARPASERITDGGPANVVPIVPDHSRVGRRRRRWLAPVAAAAAVVALGGGVLAATLSGGDDHRPAATSRTVSSAAKTSPSSAADTSVHLKLQVTGDGHTYGVGMPVIAYFSKPIKDGRALQQATTVTVDGRPAVGAWYFEASKGAAGRIEGHFRLEKYWPADSDVQIDLPIKGLSAGGGLTYDQSLTLGFRTGDQHIVTVNGANNTMSVNLGSGTPKTYPVSLGIDDQKKYATRSGVKVIMDKPTGKPVTVKSGPFAGKVLELPMRLTYGGEFLCGASWNQANIENRVDSTAGSTNLLPADATALYSQLRIGDVVDYTHTSGPKMTLAAGYGDWNVGWSTWLTGGLIPTS